MRVLFYVGTHGTVCKKRMEGAFKGTVHCCG